MGDWGLMVWGGFRGGLGWVGEGSGWVGTVVLGGLMMMWAIGGLCGGCSWVGAGAWGPWR